MVIQKERITPTQKKILQLILQGYKEIRQITKEMGMSRNAIHYQLRRLEERDLIKKKTLINVGNVSVGIVELNFLRMEDIRSILGLQAEGNALLTGCTWNPRYKDDSTLKLPDNSKMLLEREGFKINKVICFTTSEARDRRATLDLPEFDYVIHDFASYQSFNIKQSILKVLRENLEKHSVILDMTPLTKIFSIVLLELAHEYGLPIFYTVRSGDNYRIEWHADSERRLEKEGKT